MSYSGARLIPDRTEGRGRVWSCLFGLAAAGVAVLGGICLWLGAERQNGVLRESELTIQVEQLQSDLADREADLVQAQEKIERMEQFTYLTPEGKVPSYAELYPELYAQPWEGTETAGERTVYLTFDDGPSPNTDRILEILDEYGIKATFFVVGKTGSRNEQRMRDITAAGHTLGIHSWSHDYKKIYASVEAYLEDFERLYQWIYEVTGTYPQIFRFPGGSVNGYNRGLYQEIIAEMTRRGFVYFDWNASAQDATAKPLSPDVITENCLKGIGRDPVVLLAHDSAARSTTVEALPQIIEGYAQAGYEFRALDPGSEQVILNYKWDS